MESELRTVIMKNGFPLDVVPFSVKRGLNASAKGIDLGQPHNYFTFPKSNFNFYV